jgi:hypothetical protein
MQSLGPAWSFRLWSDVSIFEPIGTAGAVLARALDSARDRLVLALGPGSSSKVTPTLPSLLRVLRDGVTSSLTAAVKSVRETEVADVVETCLARS